MRDISVREKAVPQRPSILRMWSQSSIGDWIAVICVVAGLVWVLQPAVSSKTHESAVRRYAYIAVTEHLVKRGLAPATATFASWAVYDPLLKVTRGADGLYRVQGWLEAEDSSGTLVRSTFMVLVRREGNDWQWVEGDLKPADPVAKEVTDS